MSRRYLFGPVSAAFAGSQLQSARQAGACLTFDVAAGADLVIGPTDSWEAILARLPTGWQPDFIVLELAYTAIPPCLWSAPVPLVGLASEWSRLWHAYRRQLPCCDLVLADAAGAERLTLAGVAQARPAVLQGCVRAFLEHAWPNGKRDIDILVADDVNPTLANECLPWVMRLGRLGERHSVLLRSDVDEDSYRDLLGRARIVVNLGEPGTRERRGFETAAAGALLFQEADELEAASYFRDGEECVGFASEDLEGLLEHYLAHEDERRRIADSARARARRLSFDQCWAEALRGIEREWPDIVERSRHRPAETMHDPLVRIWQALARRGVADVRLTADLEKGLATAPHDAGLHNAFGVAVALALARGNALSSAQAASVTGHFRRALECEPHHLLAALNLTLTLQIAGHKQAAVEQARLVLRQVDQHASADPVVFDGVSWSPGSDAFGLEWERAAWVHAGQRAEESRAKADLLRWRLHQVLAQLTGELTHHYEAALARPDLPSSRAALATALLQGRRPVEAIPHFRAALDANPFDHDSARALAGALTETGDTASRHRLLRDRQLLAKAAPQLAPSESWFVAVPTGSELASIVILCCDQLDLTCRCVESVLRYSRPPYELILVNNGSLDGTAAYLDTLRSQDGPVRVEVIHNERNRGFSAACNQALAQAHGRYLIYLNNDTIVTDDWLKTLIAWSLHDWPRVGLVGPVTNHARPPQQILVDYQDIGGLEPFAAQRRRDYAGKGLDVNMLSSFCLLIRREVHDKIGGFDERFGLGFCEDDDLCVRAQEAGFRLLLALDVFLHHFGGRTFAGLGIDARQQLQASLERFKEKWGPERAALFHRPAPSAPVAAAAPAPTAAAAVERSRVSLCMIVKNEETNLPDCLKSVNGLFDEIVIVDTGSTDRTKEVAAGFGARVFDFPWVDDFAAARNESLRHATGDWLFWMDADDRLDDENRQKLQRLLGQLPAGNFAYLMRCLSPPGPRGGTAHTVIHGRLFRNLPDIRWRYRVHEQILPSVQEMGGPLVNTDIVIRHVGYQDPTKIPDKHRRNMRLLELEIAAKPDDAFVLFNLGQTWMDMKRPADALPHLLKCLELTPPNRSWIRRLYDLVAQCQRWLGRKDEALAICQRGLVLFPDDIDLRFQEALWLMDRGDLAGAESRLQRLLEPQAVERLYFSVDRGRCGFRARHNLAVVCLRRGRPAEAETQWLAALAEKPDHLPSLLGLGELYAKQGRWQQLERLTVRLEAGAVQEVATTVLRARVHLARREFAAGRKLVEAALVRYPRLLELRVALSDALLQEGKDTAAAEKALRDVLALDPEHAPTRQKLAALQRRVGAVLTSPGR